MFTPDVKKIISGRATAPENKFSELSSIAIDAKLKLGNDDKTIDAIYRACRERRPDTICPHVNFPYRKEQQTPWIKRPRKYESSTRGLPRAVFIVQGEDAYIGNLVILGLPQKIEIMCDGNLLYQTFPILEKQTGRFTRLNFPRIFLPKRTSIEVLVENVGRDPVLYADVYYICEEEIERATNTPRDIDIVQNYVAELDEKDILYDTMIVRLPIFYNSYLYRVVFWGSNLDFGMARLIIGDSRKLDLCYDMNQSMLDANDFSGSFYSMTVSDEPPYSKLCRDINVSGEDLTFSLENVKLNKGTLCLQFLGKLRYLDGVYKIHTS